MLIHVAAALLLSFADAQTVNRDWTFVEEADPILQTQVCRAFTGVSNSPVPLEISMAFPKDRLKAPAVFLKIAGVDRAALQLSSREAEDLVTLAPGVLYHVPTEFKKLVDVIERANHLPVAFTSAGADVKARISLSGSEKTLRLVAACLGVRETVPVEFFKELNAKIEQLGAPGANETGAQLLEFVQQAYVAHGEKVKASSALETLRASMRSLIRRETAALEALKDAQAPLDRSLARLKETTDAIASGEARLAAIPGEIQVLTQQKAEAEKVEAQKLAAFEPLRKRAEELERDVRRARNDVNSYSSAISERRNLISSNESEISSLRNEASNLSSRLRSIESDLWPLDRRRSSLRSDLNSYNVDAEKRRILNGDGRYTSLQGSISGLQSQVNQWRGELSSAQSALSSCQATPGADCGAQQARVNNASSQLQNAEWQLSSAQNEMANLERNAEWRAIQGRDEIASQLRRVEGEINDLESERDRSERRKRDIENSIIPNLENEISRARNEIPGLERSLRRAQGELSTAKAALDSYKQSVNYDAVEAEYEAARKAVKILKEGIEERETEQRRLTRKLPELRSTLASQQREVDRRTVARDREQVKVAEIQDQLQPQREQEALLAQTLATWEGQFIEWRKQYQGLANRLTP